MVDTELHLKTVFSLPKRTSHNAGIVDEYMNFVFLWKKMDAKRIVQER